MSERVAQAFAPDIIIRRTKGNLWFRNDLVRQRTLHLQICHAAYAPRALDDKPYFKCPISKKLWEGKIDHETMDLYLAAAGAMGLTVESVDDNETPE